MEVEVGVILLVSREQKTAVEQLRVDANRVCARITKMEEEET